MSLIKPGRFVIILQGRHAGQKALVAAVYPTGTETHKFPTAVVIGLDQSPSKVSKTMTQYQLVRKTQVRVFVKQMNFNHLLVTRFTISEDDIFNKISPEAIVKSFNDQAEKKKIIESLNNILHQKYLNGKFRWFFAKLKF